MEIQIITVGKLKGTFQYIQTGVDEYTKRLKPYCNISIIEVPDESIRRSVTTDQILEREAQRILPFMERASTSISLWERGQQYSSIDFSTQVLHHASGTNPPNGGIPNSGAGPMIFIVGGAQGLSQTVLDKATWLLSLSSMTLPHPLVRLVLLEQIYRGFKIYRNEPYHK